MLTLSGQDSRNNAIDKQYIVETPPRVLERCILMTTDPGDLVLDLTCGSGAMPYQAEKWGRRWIAVDVAQVSIAIARERLITNTYPYHMLKDSLWRSANVITNWSRRSSHRNRESHSRPLPAE